MSEEERQLQDQPIYFSRRHYLTLGTLLAGLIALGSALYTVLEKIYIAPKDQKIQQLEQTIANTRQETKALSLELQNTSQTYKNLLSTFENPVALEPSEGATVIGDQIPFIWDYKYHNQYQRYILEIRPISQTNNKPYRFNVPNPEQKRMHLTRTRS